MLQDQSVPLEVRQSIVQELRKQEIGEHRADLKQMLNETGLDESLQCNILLTLISLGETQFLKELMPFLCGKHMYMHEFLFDMNSSKKPQTYLNLHPVPDVAPILARHLDQQTLVALSCNQQVDFEMRCNLAYEIAKTGNDGFSEPFLAIVADRVNQQEVREAYTDALGILARDEEIVRGLLDVYRSEEDEQVRDRLFTALYKIARRANVTIVAEGPGGSVLGVVRR